MFSKALFKQSCKANGLMWAIVTFAVCFMLAAVMLISGSGSIGKTKDSIQETIITKEIDAAVNNRAVNYYDNAVDGTREFERCFTKNVKDIKDYLPSINLWRLGMPNVATYENEEAYLKALSKWQDTAPQTKNSAEAAFLKNIKTYLEKVPLRASYEDDASYKAAIKTFKEGLPTDIESAITVAGEISLLELQEYFYQKALKINKDYTKDSPEVSEMLASTLVVISPKGVFNDYYTKNGEELPEKYDLTSVLSYLLAGDSEYYLDPAREKYRADKAEDAICVLLAASLTDKDNVTRVTAELASYGVTPEKYESFGYTNYSKLRHMADTAVITYRNRLEYEISLVNKHKEKTLYETDLEYQKALADAHNEFVKDIGTSFLRSLPAEVSTALEEIGKADLYSLIIGSIFYKLAGILLPIIYMIMTSNNLIVAQVDSGSMAYVLSTSTKRKTVAFTQMVYLVGSLFAMFFLSAITGCISLCFVEEEASLTFSSLILLNVGAFLVLFALSGLCFLTSCWFDRSKRSMALGGGLSVFALVAAMLGLFGSKVLPSVVRLETLNFFNYFTIISLFDAISIVDGSINFLWKFAILLAIGLTGYIIGTIKFIKKDLPL